MVLLLSDPRSKEINSKITRFLFLFWKPLRKQISAKWPRFVSQDAMLSAMCDGIIAKHFHMAAAAIISKWVWGFPALSPFSILV